MIAIVIEDGTGKSDADSYQSLDDVQAYADAVGKTFDKTETVKAERACRLATIRLDLDYEDRFPALRMNADQALAFPRGWFYDRNRVLVESETIPKAITDAHAELAIRSYGGDDLFPDTTNRVLTAKTDDTDAYSQTLRYAPAPSGVDGEPLKKYPIVDVLLAAILTPRVARRM